MALTLEDVMDPKAQMIILDPGGYLWISVKLEGCRGLPATITYAEVDMALLGLHPRLSCMPGDHITCGPYGPVVVFKYQFSGLGVIGLNGVPDVFDYLAHVQDQCNEPAHIVIAYLRYYADLIRHQEFLDDGDYLGQQLLFAAWPFGAKPVEDLDGRVEDDLLHAELIGVGGEIYGRSVRGIDIAAQDLGHICPGDGIPEDQLQWPDLFHIKAECRLHLVFYAGDLRPLQFILLLLWSGLNYVLGSLSLCLAPVSCFMGHKSERHAEDVDVIRREEAGLFIDIVICAPETSPHLLA